MDKRSRDYSTETIDPMWSSGIKYIFLRDINAKVKWLYLNKYVNIWINANITI